MKTNKRWPTKYRVIAVVVLLGAAVVAYQAAQKPSVVKGPPCLATANGVSFGFDIDQGMNATTIAAVGRKLGLPDHAVTIALATALQESGLHNLSYGDLDSVGLFQQRPSQGWGTVDQIMDPRYAANAFYSRLVKVKNWQDLPVTEAAQSVQRSAAPTAYAQWEAGSRVLAQALTGQVQAGFACRDTVKKQLVSPPEMTTDLKSDLGSAPINKTVTDEQGWLVAGWLIAHAQQYGVASVNFDGQRWTAEKGKWVPTAPVAKIVTLNH